MFFIKAFLASSVSFKFPLNNLLPSLPLNNDAPYLNNHLYSANCKKTSAPILIRLVIDQALVISESEDE
jgi:hypothetical protein